MSVAAGVVGLIVPALHGVRVFKADLERIIDGLGAVARLMDDVGSIDGSLALLKDIDKPT